MTTLLGSRRRAAGALCALSLLAALLWWPILPFYGERAMTACVADPTANQEDVLTTTSWGHLPPGWTCHYQKDGEWSTRRLGVLP